MANFSTNNQVGSSSAGLNWPTGLGVGETGFAPGNGNIYEKAKGNFRPSTQPSINFDTATFSRAGYFNNNYTDSRFPFGGNQFFGESPPALQLITMINPDIIRGTGLVSDLKLPQVPGNVTWDLANARVSGGNNGSLQNIIRKKVIGAVPVTAASGDRRLTGGIVPVNRFTNKRQLPFIESDVFGPKKTMYPSVVNDYQRRTFGTITPDSGVGSSTEYPLVVIDDETGQEKTARKRVFPIQKSTWMILGKQNEFGPGTGGPTFALDPFFNGPGGAWTVAYNLLVNFATAGAGGGGGVANFDTCTVFFNGRVFEPTAGGANDRSGFLPFGARASKRLQVGTPAFPGIGGPPALRSRVPANVANSQGAGSYVADPSLRPEIVTESCVEKKQSKVQLDKAVTNTSMLNVAVPGMSFAPTFGFTN